MSDAFDLVVAGSGIAGLSAALTGARLGLRTLILTGDVLGGQLLSINRIDGYPGFPDGVAGYDLCPITQEQAVAAGAEITATALDTLEAQDGRWRLATGEGDLVARAVVLATGARVPRSTSRAPCSTWRCFSSTSRARSSWSFAMPRMIGSVIR